MVRKRPYYRVRGADVREIIDAFESGMTRAEIAAVMPYSYSKVCLIIQEQFGNHYKRCAKSEVPAPTPPKADAEPVAEPEPIVADNVRYLAVPVRIHDKRVRESRNAGFFYGFVLGICVTVFLSQLVTG